MACWLKAALSGLVPALSFTILFVWFPVLAEEASEKEPSVAEELQEETPPAQEGTKEEAAAGAVAEKAPAEQDAADKALPDQPPASSDSSAKGGESSSAEEVLAPGGTPSAEQMVEPLEVWIPIEPQKPDQPGEEVSEEVQRPRNFLDLMEEEFAKEDPQFDEESEESEKVVIEVARPAPSAPEKHVLSNMQKKRIDRAKKLQRERALVYRRTLAESFRTDPRGAPEIRLCSVNMNNYGLGGEVKKLVKESVAKLRARQKSVISAIASADCDIVALQQIIGREPHFADDALKYFAKKLRKETTKTWKTLRGESNHRHIYNAFAFNSDKATLVSMTGHTDKLLPRFDQFKEKKFARAPFEVAFRVKGQEGAPTRDIVALTMHFGAGIAHIPKGKEMHRMQMAEGLRQLVLYLQQFVDPTDPPIFVLLGDRVSTLDQPSAAILEGRLELTDFREKEKCSLSKEEKTECTEKPKSAVTLFGLLTHDRPPPPTLMKRRDEEGEIVRWYKKPDPKSVRQAQAVKKRRTQEIYMLPADLHYAWKERNAPGRYQVGWVKVKNGIKGSQLVWIELNWK